MSSEDRQPLLVIVGPTASGKTELSLELAERLGGEIVSADSVQVYRHFEIGTGKPSSAERAVAPHHLLDIVDPLEEMDAARWAGLAERTISEIEARGRAPIVCGGTFLWVRALIFGLAAAPPGDPEIRKRHRDVVESLGRSELHSRLARVDAPSALRLAPNDFVRVSRALEVFELTGIPLSQWQAEHGFRSPRRPARLVGLRRERHDLDARIRARTEKMFQAGWVEEVRRLKAAGYGAARAMSSVGYRQISEAIERDADIDEATLVEGVVRQTRVFARRQRTWLRDQPVEWVSSALDLDNR